MMMAVSLSHVVYGYAVAALAGVIYDWGEQDSITLPRWYSHDSSIALTLSQEVGIYHEQSSRLAKIYSIDWADMGEHSSILEE